MRQPRHLRKRDKSTGKPMDDHRVFRDCSTLYPAIISAAQAVTRWDLGRPKTYRLSRFRRDCYCGLSITDAVEIAELAVNAYLRHKEWAEECEEFGCHDEQESGQS